MYQRATKWMDETICSELQGSFPAAHCILSHPSIWWLSGTSPSVPCCPSFRQSFWQLASNARPPAQQVRGSSDSTNFCRPSIAGAPGIVEPLAVAMHDGFGGHVHEHPIINWNTRSHTRVIVVLTRFLSGASQSPPVDQVSNQCFPISESCGV